jgi:hypothetical protein
MCVCVCGAASREQMLASEAPAIGKTSISGLDQTALATGPLPGPAKYAVIELSMSDRHGLLSDVTALLAKQHLSVISAATWSQHTRAAMVLFVEVCACLESCYPPSLHMRRSVVVRAQRAKGPKTLHCGAYMPPETSRLATTNSPASHGVPRPTRGDSIDVTPPPWQCRVEIRRCLLYANRRRGGHSLLYSTGDAGV